MVAALMKLTQGALSPPAGQSLLGVGGVPVTLSNDNNTGVVRWTYELLNVPNGSALTPGILSDGAVPTAILTPDTVLSEVHGCYRLKLTVYDSGGVTSSNIRNFAIGTPNHLWILPSFLAVADEMNFGGQLEGWKKYVNDVLLAVDLLDSRWSLPPDSSVRFLAVGRSLRFGAPVNRYNFYSAYFGHNCGIGQTGIPPSGDGRNFAMGNNALLSITTANRCIAQGMLAGAAVSSASHCGFLGYYTGAGGISAPIPYYITGDYNYTLGSYGLYSLRDGDGNVGVGFRNLENVRDGNRNTGLGWYPLDSVQDGDDNAALGTLAGPLSDYDGTLSLGAGAYTRRAWTGQIGGEGPYAIDVGFGLSAAPTARLHLPAGQAAAGKAPLKLDTGVLLTVPENGTVEFDNVHWWGTVGGVRKQLDNDGTAATQREDDGVAQRTVRGFYKGIQLQWAAGVALSSVGVPVPGSLVAYRARSSGVFESGFFFLTFGSGAIHVRSSSAEGANVVDNSSFASTLSRGKAIQVISEYAGEDDAIAVFTEAEIRLYKASGGNNGFTFQVAINPAAYTGDPTICGRWLYVADTITGKIYATLARMDGVTAPTDVLTLANLTESIVGDSFGNLWVITDTGGVSTLRKYTTDQSDGSLTANGSWSFGANGSCTTNLTVDGRYVFCASVQTGTYYLVRFDIALGTIASVESSISLPSRSYVVAGGEFIWASGTNSLACWDPEQLFELDTPSHAGEGGSATRGLASDPDSRTATVLLAALPGVATINFSMPLPNLRASGLSFSKSSLKSTGATKVLGLNSKNEVVTTALSGSSILMGTYASRPAAGTAGRVYFCSDGPIGQWIDDGTRWLPLLGGGNVQGVQVPAAAGFTAFNAAGASIVDYKGALKFEFPGDASGTIHNHGYVIAAPSSTYWVEAAVNIHSTARVSPVNPYVMGLGITVRQASTGQAITLQKMIDRKSNYTGLQHGTFSSDTVGAIDAVGVTDNTYEVFVRIGVEAYGDVFLQYSRDRKDWFDYDSYPVGDVFGDTPDQLGICALTNGGVTRGYVEHFTYGAGSLP